MAFVSSLSHAGPDSFYVTNDNFFHFDNTMLRVLYGLLLHKWLHSNIVFFDGFKAIEAIGGVHPNGINMDKNERLACCSCKYGCYLMNCKTQRTRYHDLHISERQEGYWNPGYLLNFRPIPPQLLGNFARPQISAISEKSPVSRQQLEFEPNARTLELRLGVLPYMSIDRIPSIA